MDYALTDRYCIHHAGKEVPGNSPAFTQRYRGRAGGHQVEWWELVIVFHPDIPIDGGQHIPLN